MISQTESRKLRTEILRVLNDHMFTQDIKSHLLLDVFRRFENRVSITKQRCLQNQFKEKEKVLVGGGEIKDDSKENHLCEEETDASKLRDMTPEKQGVPAPQPSAATQHLARIWLNQAVDIVESFMKNKVNVLFLHNVKYHANRIAEYFEKNGILDSKNRSIFTPNKQLYIKNHSLYTVEKGKDSISFDLAKLLAYISLSKNKLYKFLKYRHKFVSAVTEKEKKFLRVFLKECPVNKRRIPCKIIRNFAS